MPGNRAKRRTSSHQSAHETFIASFIIVFRLRRHGAARAPQRRACDDLDLPAHIVAAGRLQLPPSSNLFGLWRRSARTFRAVGWRLDDAGAAAALSALGHLRNRQRATDRSAGRAMVPALAVRAMARRQCAMTCRENLSGRTSGNFWVARPRPAADAAFWNGPAFPSALRARVPPRCARSPLRTF